MSPFNEPKGKGALLDGAWISLNGALKLELRGGRFTEIHRFPDAMYRGVYEIVANCLILTDDETGLRTMATLESCVIQLRDDTFVRVH